MLKKVPSWDRGHKTALGTSPPSDAAGGARGAKLRYIRGMKMLRPLLAPLAFALILAGFTGQASATDLVQAYDKARQSDPQFAASEAQKNATAEGVVQSRSALLPQVSADASSMCVSRYGNDGLKTTSNQLLTWYTPSMIS